jgi:hypothetical protein
MKTILRLFKPFLKKLLLAAGTAEEDKSINFIEAQVMRLNLPISGEQLDAVVKLTYETIETIIINKVDQI